MVPWYIILTLCVYIYITCASLSSKIRTATVLPLFKYRNTIRHDGLRMGFISLIPSSIASRSQGIGHNAWTICQWNSPGTRYNTKMLNLDYHCISGQFGPNTYGRVGYGRLGYLDLPPVTYLPFHHASKIRASPPPLMDDTLPVRPLIKELAMANLSGCCKTCNQRET